MKKAIKRNLIILVGLFLFYTITFNSAITTFAEITDGMIIGSINLPDGLTAQNDIEVTFELYNKYDNTYYDSTTEIISKDTNSTLFMFSSVTPQDGYFIFYYLSDSSSYFPFGYFGGDQGSTLNENNSYIIDLTYSDYDATITLLNKDISPTLSLNQPQNGNLTDINDVNYFTFIPDSTQNYVCESFGDIDTFGEIYDSNLYKVEGSFSDDMNTSDGLLNFRIFTELQANETYYIRVKTYSDLENMPYSIKISKNDPSSLDGDLIVRSTSLQDDNQNEISVLKPSETVYANVEATNISIEEKEGTLVMMLFNGNKLEKVQFSNKIVSSGYNESFTGSMKMPDNIDGRTLRITFWNNADEMKPYSTVIHNISDK